MFNDQQHLILTKTNMKFKHIVVYEDISDQGQGHGATSRFFSICRNINSVP